MQKEQKSLKKIEQEKKYFLVFEGSRTEEIYFDTINELKGKIGINPLIEIISIERTYSEYGWSNPKKILEQLLKDLEEIEDGKLSYKTLVDKIMEIIVEDKNFSLKISKKSNLKEVIEDIENEIESLENTVKNIEEDCITLLSIITKKVFLVKEEIANILEKVLENIGNQQITYSEDIDKMCLIVDRDKKVLKKNNIIMLKKSVKGRILNFM